MKKKVLDNPLSIAIAGSSGLVGKELVTFLTSLGHRVIPIVRKSKNKNEILWDLDRMNIEQEKLEGFDAVINLAGENIGSGYWTLKKKKRIRNSRIISTQILIKALNQLKKPPKVLISASSVGYYGSQTKGMVNEGSQPGIDFLAKICVDWEKEANKFQKGRVVTPRFGIILTPKGGALKKILPPFKLGFGGKFGSGKQSMSWIALDDVIDTLYHLLIDQTLSGPINVTSPNPVTNKKFSKSLAQLLSRPNLFTFPSFLIRLLFGEMANGTILSNIKAYPLVLEKAGKQLRYPDLNSALGHLLNL